MRRFLTVLLASTLVGCAGGTLYTSLAGVSSVAPTDAYVCAEKQLQLLEYRRTQYDNKALFIIGERRNDDEAGHGATFRKTLDILEVYVKVNRTGPDSDFVFSDRLEGKLQKGIRAEDLIKGLPDEDQKLEMIVGSDRGTRVQVKVHGIPMKPVPGEWKAGP